MLLKKPGGSCPRKLEEILVEYEEYNRMKNNIWW